MTTTQIVVPLLILSPHKRHKQQLIPHSLSNIDDNVDIGNVIKNDNNDNINNNVEMNEPILEDVQPSEPLLRRSQ